MSRLASRAEPAGVLTFEEAYEAVLEYCRTIKPPAPEQLPLLASLGRVLAEPVHADRDFPPFSRSTRDGYAVRAADLANLPAELQVIGQIKAGANFRRQIESGETAEIMTGAAAPAGTDSVVMVEYTERDGDRVRIKRATAAGENVVSAGSEARAGQELLPRALRLSAALVAMAAAAGETMLSLYGKPRVTVLATGDELVDVDQAPGPRQIRNSNSYFLAAEVAARGGEPLRSPVAPDEESKLTALIQGALNRSDMLLLSGGVSMGKFDLVEGALQKLGARFFFTGARIQPGKPVVFGELAKDGGKIPFFGLPGNPVSVMVTFELFVSPVLDAISGATPKRLPACHARLRSAFKTKPGLTRFLPATLTGSLYDAEVDPVPWHGSGDLLASAKANCYLVIPPDREMIAAGEMVSVLVR
ncbi:MAG: molybdopterin molybdotransferase MoeA [Candidatus Angelobacter sp.]